MKGIEEYTSRAGIPVLRIHYTADPERDPSTPEGAEWMKGALRGIPGGMNSSHWRQEQEIDWEATGGDLVFPQLEAFRSKIVVPPFEIPDSWRLFAAFDYGHRNPSSFHIHAIDYDNRIWTIWEYYESGKGYKHIANAIRSCPYYDRLVAWPVADPSIFDLTQQTESGVKSLAQLFHELPPLERVYFLKGKHGGDVTVAEKINGNLWADLETTDSNWRIFATCPKLIWELSKLRWAEWSATQQASRNLKEEIVDRDNHAWDDFKMFVTQFFQAPVPPKEDKYEKLKREDPASYRAWSALDKMRKRDADGAMGDFG